MIELILAQDVTGLAKNVFNQTLENDGNTHTQSLTQEEETAAIEQLISGKKPEEWKRFLFQYMEHYPLFNEAEILLIPHVEYQELLFKEFRLHGCSPSVLMEICQFVIEGSLTPEGQKLLEAAIEHSRVFFDVVTAKLAQIDCCEDTDYADAYRKMCRKVHKKENLLGFDG